MVNAFSFSYTPKPSTALAAITPLKLLGEGRESLRFTASTPMSFIKQNPEVVTEGFWKGRQALTEGIVKGTTSALSGVAGALTSKAAETKADDDAITAHTRAKEIANIKAAPTAAETAYQQHRSDLLAQQIASAKEKIKESTEGIDSTAVEPGEIDFSRFQNYRDPVPELPPPTATPVTAPAPAAPPVAPAAPAAPAPPAAPVVSNAPVAPAGVRSFAPGDATKGLFQFDQGTGTDVFGNMPPRQSSMAFNLAPIPQTEAMVAAAPAAVPAVTQTAPKSVFGQSTNGLVPIRETLKKTEAISGAAPVPAPPPTPVLSALTLPESAGEMTLNDDTIQLMPVSEAEGVLAPKTAAKPLERTTPPPVEPPLPVAQPTATTQPSELTKDQYDEVRYQIESQLTGRPFKSLADARRATQVLEQTLGVKAQITTEKGEKGSRLHYVEIVDEAPAAKTAPEGYFTESIRDADGKETYVYKPKIPVEQQVKSVDVAIDRAKTLKTAISEIRGIIGGISPGVGGAANLMAKLPFPTDASTVESLNETIKGIIGFQELVDLKAAGGSLGALSDAELKMLTSLQGSLDVKNLHKDKYLAVLTNIESRASDVEKKMEAHKKDLMNVEKKTNFQPIQSEKRTYQKGQVAIVNGNSYKWDGNQWNLIQ
jgi:hypothetical protein